MNKGVKILLIAAAIACFGAALYYPLHYRQEQSSNANNMEELAALRLEGMASEDQAETTDNGNAGPSAELTRTAPAEPEAPEAEAPEAQSEATEGEAPEGEPREVPASEPEGKAPSGAAQGEVPAAETEGEAPGGAAQEEVPASETQGQAGQSQTTESTSTSSGGEEEAAAADATVQATGGAAEIAATSPKSIAAVPKGEQSGAEGGEASVRPEETGAEVEETPSPEPTPTPSPTPNRRERSGALPYPDKEKVEFDESKILGRYKAIYQLNKDFIGWITIPGTDVDYPVVQTKDDGDYYLHHDFFGEDNNNGQIILDPLCDPYTPSYNLVISGHNMRSGSMFGNLDSYTSKSYWSNHKFIQFDTLMDERHYVILAAFYSADYDIDEKGFRYNADIQYRMDAEQWLREVANNRLYDTGIEADFGDEFLTLTTCNYARRKDGRFVLVCRRIREGETFE